MQTGGRQGKIPTPKLERYDFREKKWEKLPDIPGERVFAVYCTDNERIFSCGGLNKDPRQGMSDSMEYFDIKAGL